MSGPPEQEQVEEEEEKVFEKIEQTMLSQKSFGSMSSFLKKLGKNVQAHTSRTGTHISKEEFLNQHLAAGSQFTDPDFPPDKTSLIKNWEDYNNVKIYTWNKYTWKRVTEIYPQPIKVFNSIDPNDIRQGELGDCYFLSSLSALAEKPSRIERLFETPEYDPHGCYKIRIGEMGELKEIIIDDFVPCNLEGKVAFSKSKREVDHSTGVGEKVAELWVMLLEKAWAKKFGSYLTIDAGFVNEVLSDLTGAPCKVMSTDVDNLWEELVEADRADYIIAASTSKEAGAADDVGLEGLVGEHAYAVISVAEVPTSAGPERIMKIRNPWGETEWNGDWSDNSPKWTPELKAQLNVTEVNDGTFWMPFTEFTRFFIEVCICKVHDDYVNQFMRMEQQPGDFSVVQVTVAQPVHTYVTVSQVDMRLLDKFEDYDYSDVRIICTKLQPGGALEFISSRGRSGKGHMLERDVFEGLRLEPGDYLIFLKVDFPEVTPTTEYGLSLYSSGAVEMRNVTQERQDFLTQLFSVENAKRHGEKSTPTAGCTAYSWSLAGNLNRENLFKAGYLADVFQNETADKTFEVGAFHRSFDNVALMAPLEGDSYKFLLPPGQSHTVVKEQVMVGVPFSCQPRLAVRAKK